MGRGEGLTLCQERDHRGAPLSKFDPARQRPGQVLRGLPFVSREQPYGSVQYDANDWKGI